MTAQAGEKLLYKKKEYSMAVVPIGKMLCYVHSEYDSVYEKELILEFKEGVLVSEKEIDNSRKFQ